MAISLLPLLHSLFLLSAATMASGDVVDNVDKYPMVVSTWPFVEAVRAAWTAAADGFSAVDSVVEGCSACEELGCDGTVGPGGSPDEYGETTLDALVMNGETMEVGAVAAMRYVKDGIRAARLVMQHTEHTLLVGEKASDFALSMGLPGPTDLSSSKSLKKWIRWKENGCQPNFWKNVLPTNSCGPYTPKSSQGIDRGKCPSTYVEESTSTASSLINIHNHDTISMTVFDKMGHVAAGTSTNGASFKIPGRVGDGPIAGSSAYADDEVGACGATGDGDIMMRFLPCSPNELVEPEQQEVGATQEELKKLLESLVSDLTISIHIPRSKRKKQRLLRAPTEAEFPYHRLLRRARESSKLDNCQFYQLGNLEDGGMGYLGVVMEEKTPRIQLERPRQTFGCPLLYPLDKVSYREDGVNVVALIYPPFMSFAKHFRADPNAMTRPTFRPLIKGIIRALIDLETLGHEPWEIEVDTMIVHEGNVGGLLCTSPHAAKHLSSKYWKGCFAKVKEVVEKLTPTAREDAKKAGSFIKEESLPSDLKTLLVCMGQANTRPQRLRLLKAPYFLSASQKVFEFIPRAYAASWGSTAFHRQFPRRDYGWVKKVEMCQYKEMKEILEGGYYSYYDGWSSSDLLRYARNCVMHLNEEETKWQHAIQDAKDKEEDLLPRVWKKRDNVVSTLMEHPELFLDVLNNLVPDFLDTVFRLSYKVDSFIHCLDEKESDKTDTLEGAGVST